MMKNDNYVPLHVHTSPGSLGDSILKIEEYIKKAKNLGINSLAITDHGSMSEVYTFYKECINNDIKPIIGCEVYEAVNNRLLKDTDNRGYFHLILLAKNEIGFKNLLTIVNDSNNDGFYYKPRTDISFLKNHGEGIIALSACVAGKIPQLILADEGELAIKAIKEYQSIFDEFFLELQPGDFEEQKIVNDGLLELSEYLNIPLVVTNDIHYLDKEDYQAHDAHVKISLKKKIDDPQVYPDKCYFFSTRDELIHMFKNIPSPILDSAINNSVFISTLCNLDLDLTINMPKFNSVNSTSELLLYDKCFKKLNEIKHAIPDMPLYTERLLYELDTICKLGFASYFLMVEDFINYARENDISVGPGRGSVGGSLAAYLLDICVADPIKYGLLFERFLSIHRKSIPDIDIDFSSDKRHLMFEYAVNKYGFNNCSLVSTKTFRKSRSAVKDTARILGIAAEEANTISKLIPSVYYDDDGEKTVDLSIDESLSIVPELREYDKKYPELFPMAKKLCDLASSSSIHAAGILISPKGLGDYIPLIRSNNENINATALDLTASEEAGFVKFDFLSLSSLSVYDKTQKDVGIEFDYLNCDFNDQDVWDLIGSKYTTGLFQISSQTYKTRMPRLKPTNIKELANDLALVRGPCISSGDDRKYMDIVSGKLKVELVHELYDKVTKDTNGILIYQEQIMEIAVAFGLSLEDGYKLVKIVSKKKIDKLKEFEDRFRTSASNFNISNSALDRIWNIILDSGKYAFNASHAVSYAILCYVSAYLKLYYPREFLCNLLTNAFNRKKKEEILEAITDCRRLGFQFLPVDINISQWEFAPEGDNKIRVGMCSITSLGLTGFEEIDSQRPFESFEDCLERCKKSILSKRSIVPCIFSGLFDSLYGNRLELYNNYMESRKEEPLEVIKLQTREQFNIKDKAEDIELLLTCGNFINDPSNNMDSCGYHNVKIGNKIQISGIILNIKKIKDKTGKNMAFITLATGDGHIEFIAFNNVLTANNKLIKKNKHCIFIGKKESKYQCVLEEVLEVEV